MTKVKNAQDFGAEAVIISDFPDQGWADKEKMKFDNKLDGSLASHIPAFEIAFNDAKQMVGVIHAGQEAVYMKATFDVTNADNSVEVDLYYSTSLDLGTTLSTELAAMSTSFSADHASKPLFTPRIASFECLNCTRDFQKENCVSNGVYCGYTPNFFKEYDLDKVNFTMTGRDVIIQALREKCLHRLMSDKYKDEGDLFFTFFSYLETCFADVNKNVTSSPKSLNECYDWSTVLI